MGATIEQRGNTLSIGRRRSSRTRPSYSGRWISASIDSLPDDLLFEILVHVPAEDIHENARFVSWRWNRIIRGKDFAYAHLHRTDCGLFFLVWNFAIRESSTCPNFVTATRGGIKLSNLSYKIGYTFISSCNGLILGRDRDDDEHKLCIVNTATQARFDLPQFFDGASPRYWSMAYAAASMEYKVVATYHPDSNEMLAQCAILTVGVDKTWRHVAIDQLSPRAKDLLHCYTLTTEGFIHWVSTGHDVLSLNVETETFIETTAPPRAMEEGRRCSFLPTGRRQLSALVSCGDLMWEVWEMEAGEACEWRKLPSVFDLRPRRDWLRELCPDEEDDEGLLLRGWIQYPDILALGYDCDLTCIVYDNAKGEIESFELADYSSSFYVHMHKKSLVWIS